VESPSIVGDPTGICCQCCPRGIIAITNSYAGIPICSSVNIWMKPGATACHVYAVVLLVARYDDTFVVGSLSIVIWKSMRELSTA